MLRRTEGATFALGQLLIHNPHSVMWAQRRTRCCLDDKLERAPWHCFNERRIFGAPWLDHTKIERKVLALLAAAKEVGTPADVVISHFSCHDACPGHHCAVSRAGPLHSRWWTVRQSAWIDSGGMNICERAGAQYCLVHDADPVDVTETPPFDSVVEWHADGRPENRALGGTANSEISHKHVEVCTSLAAGWTEEGVVASAPAYVELALRTHDDTTKARDFVVATCPWPI
mmetsp:Transcript_74778/g.132274  ORF Transcript_74778/g.132274 Transcript_74778/m.132274 type:complete len:230 (-) Transcript_74778:754-1443(-)